MAKAGYCKKENFHALDAKGIAGYASLRWEAKRTQRIDAKQYPATARVAEKQTMAPWHPGIR
jgi:hypothetical protein